MKHHAIPRRGERGPDSPLTPRHCRSISKPFPGPNIVAPSDHRPSSRWGVPRSRASEDAIPRKTAGISGLLLSVFSLVAVQGPSLAVLDGMPPPTTLFVEDFGIKNDGLYRTKKGVTAKVERPAGTHDWTKIGPGLPSIVGLPLGLVDPIQIDIYRSNPSYVYAGVRQPRVGYGYGIYRSTNEGDSFEALEEYPTGELNSNVYNAFIRVHPSLPGMVYFGGVDLWQWSAYNPPPGETAGTYKVHLLRCDMKELEFLPSCSASCATYYLACDQGMIRCAASNVPSMHYKNSKVKFGQAGDTISMRNNNLRVMQFYDFDVGSAIPAKVIGGTQDTGTALYEGNPIWRKIRGGDGYYSLVGPSSSPVLYSQHQGFLAPDPRRSTMRSGDGGKSWQAIATPNNLPSPPQVNWNGYITMDPNYPNTVLAAGSSGDATKGGQVYVTTNADLAPNCTWTPSGPFGTAVKGSVRRVVVQPGTTHWFAGTSVGQIWYSWAKSQGSWSLVDSHPDQASVLSMAFSPKDEDVLYVLYSGGKTYRRVQRLEKISQGSWVGSWINDNLGADDTSGRGLGPKVICGDGHKSHVAYVGTEHGVYCWDGTRPAYDSWRPYNDGLPLTTVVDLEFGPDNMLYAATKGRGAWVVITTGP